MQKFSRLTVICAVFFIALLLFPAVAHAKESETPELPPGTGTVVDTFNSDDGRKFYTIQTPAGNTFYLIIDFTRQSENVYFLDAVNERDLIALAEKAKATSGGDISDPEAPPVEQTPGNQDPKPQDNSLMLFIVAVIVVAAGGAGFYFKKRGKKQNVNAQDDYEEYDELESYNDSNDYNNGYGAEQMEQADIPEEWRDDDD